MRRSPTLVMLAPALALACQRGPSADTGLSGGGGAPAGSTSSGSTADDGTSTATASASTTGSWGGTTSTSTGWLREDLGVPDLPQGSACNGKIDLAFVISQGGGMGEYIDVLYASYPEILATIQEEFAGFDLHVMFVDPNDRWATNHVCPKGICPEDGGCPVEGYEDFPCWAFYDEDAVSKCDNTIGAGVVFPAGELASNEPCDMPAGQRYLDGDDPLFAERFGCIAHTGIGGSSNMTGWALGEALSWDLRYGCNEGFLRDDALLFVVTLWVRDYSPYNPYVWAQRALEAKGGEQDMIVALGIGSDLSASSEPLCDGDPKDELGAMHSWCEEFEHHVFGSVCAPTYAPFFAEAAAMAVDLCANGPQG